MSLLQFSFKHNQDNKTLLRSLLMQFHHILATIPFPSLLHTLLCATLPLPSPAIAGRVVSNCCTITTNQADVHAISTLLHVIPEGDFWETAWKTATTLILNGISGTTEDIFRSCSLANACLNSCQDELRKYQFLATLLRQFVHKVKSVDRSIHPGLQNCISCVLDLTEDRCSQLLWDLWNDLSTANEVPTIVHLADIYLSVLPSFQSFFIVFCPRFLHQIVTTLAAFNHDCHVHARLLHLLAELLPLLELIPVLSEESWLDSHWRQQKLTLEEDRQAFIHLFHRNVHVLLILIQ